MRKEKTDDNERRQLIEQSLEYYREMRNSDLSYEDALELMVAAVVSAGIEEGLRDTAEITDWLEASHARRAAWRRLGRDVLAVIAALHGAKADISA